ncbi:DUF4129 domain-containing protein [Halopiger aswanensis]|uniref:Uncharacterized protein DUF4129 n=1 Tax=Halopiger aswanensis TaxID=148449 RepID=A0A3R7HX39_9EURY|nr:DUF4129 domain-containing protein [Halopiger aswanensis]RKD94005.1 uncharacterized protein DUF4129 [Halopiger aswanensis]
MGSGSTDAGDESVDSSTAAATGPDWGQVALVLVAAAILALAAVTIPPLGGVGFQGQGPAQPAGEEGSSGLLQLGSGGDGGGGAGDHQLGSDAAGSADGTDSGTGGDQPGETGDGAGGSGAGSGAGSGTGTDAESGSDSGSEVGDAGDGQQDGTAGGRSGSGSETGSADGEGTGEPSQGEFGTGSGDGTTGSPGDGTAEEPGGRSDGTSTDGRGSPADGTTSGDGISGSSGEQTDGTGTETGDGDGSGESTGDGSADGDESTTGDGDSSSPSQDGGGDGDTGSGDGSSESDSESGSGGQESGDGDESENGEDTEDSSDDETGDEDGTSYDISFDEQPTPGSTVEVTVTGDGDPVEDATVYFNDERIGTTDADGTVTGEVPYTETLEVRAEVSPTETETTTARGSASISGPTLPGLDASRQFHGTVAMPLSAAQDSQTEDGNESETGNGAQTTVEMNPETELTIDGAPIAGTNVTVVATVDGNPIPQGAVSIDGEEYGTTGDDGAAVVPVPETPGNATIAVERGEIRAERTVTVETLSLTVEDRFPLPGRPVDARLEYGNESVANATILVDGAAAATTGADGTATVGLPLANEATIAATYEGARATTTVDGLYRNAALLALAVVGGLLLFWRLSARYGVGDRVRSLPSPASLLQRLGDALRTLGRRTVDAIVRLARSLESLGYWIVDRARAVARALERAGRWLVELPGELATKGLAALSALHPIRLYRYLRDAIRSLLRSSRERADDVSEAVTGTDGTAAAGDEETDEDVRTLRELWAEFVRLVRPPRLRTKTPGEVGRYAVEKGFPEPPVRTVVDAFRDSEYGETAPSDDRLERVRSAVRSVTDGDDTTADDTEDENDGENGGDRP